MPEHIVTVQMVIHVYAIILEKTKWSRRFHRDLQNSQVQKRLTLWQNQKRWKYAQDAQVCIEDKETPTTRKTRVEWT